MSTNYHEKIEKSVPLMAVFTVIAIAFGALVEITPLMFQKDTTTPVANMRALTPLEMEGRDVYIREGCNSCHSQMIRPFRSEVERYGHYSVAGESVWDHPFLWGSKRTGPDLARVGGRYSDEWHRVHLIDPRAVVPQSNMSSFKWLEETVLTGDDIAKKLEVFNTLTAGKTHKDENGNYIPLYSAADIAGAKEAVEGKTEMDALIAYLQQLGTHLK